MLALLFLLALTPPEDPRVAALLAHAVPVRTIGLTDDDDRDLAPIGAAIGDARVVLLGDPTHGDGAAFLAQSRLVRYLHREKGFTVLAWEAGLYDCHVMQQKLEDESLRTDEAASWGVFTIWGASAQCIPLFHYARSTYGGESPLRMAGIDCQFSARGGEGWLDFILGWIDAADAEFLPEDLRRGLRKARRRLELSPFFPTPEQLARDREIVRRLDALLAAPDGPVIAHYGEDEVSFVRRTLHNFIVQSELRLLFQRPETRHDGNRLRDRTMADNLVWLATERSPDSKIVVWTSATAAARRLPTVDLDLEGFSFDGTVTVADMVHEALGEDAYSIVFTAYDGLAGSILQPPFEVAPAPPDSLEDLCRRTGEEVLFVDLRHAPTEGDASFLDQAFVARPFSYTPGVARWRDVCDAFFFIRTMTPSTIPDSDDFGE